MRKITRRDFLCGSAAAVAGTMMFPGLASADVDTSEQVEIIMYVVSDRPAGQDVVDENLNQLLLEKLNCTLKINWIGWTEYQNKYPLLFSSGETFDIAYAATWLNFASLAQKGAFLSLDEMWEEYAPDNFALQSETALAEATISGHYYCVPTLLSTYTAYGPIYRTDLTGEDWDGVMETWEDVEEYGDAILANNQAIEPIDIYSMGPELMLTYMQSLGYMWVSKSYPWLWFDPTEENPTVKSLYQFDEIKDFLEMTARFNEKGFWSKSALSDTDSTKLQNGKSALRFHNIDTYASCVANYGESVGQSWGYSNFVADNSHLPYTQDCMVISNTSKNPERAMALINLITTDQEVFDALMYGVEGVTYELNDEGQFTITDTDLYAGGALWAARSDALVRYQAGYPEDYATKKEEIEASIVAGVNSEKFAPFVFDTSSIETELSTCVNVQQQYWWPLELGYTDKDSGLEQYQSMMEIAGIDTVIAEAQAQIDAYIASL